MRVRHVMNKHGSGLEQSDQAATPSASNPENNAELLATELAKEQEIELVDMQAPSQLPQNEGTSMLAPKEEDLIAPESPWTGDMNLSKLGQTVEKSYSALLHSPDKWYSLNKLLNQKGGRDILFRMEDVIKERGLAPVREEFLQIKPQVNADLIWSLHQPLLSLMLFILKEQNDIHRKLIRVPELKSDICKAMGLGRPSKVKPAPPPKPKLERQPKMVTKPKGLATGEKKLKKKVPKPDPLRTLLYPPSGAGAAYEDTKGGDQEAGASGFALGTPPAKKLKTGDKLTDSQTLHQLIAASQERDRSGKFAPGFSPVAALKLKKKKVTKPGADKGLGKGLGKRLGKKTEKAAENGASIKKLAISSPKTSSRKQLTPRRAPPADGGDGAGPSTSAEPRAPRVEPVSREDAEIAALVCALRTRGEKEARVLEAMAVPELDERIGELEAARNRTDAELVQLRARRRALIGEGDEEARERAVGESVRAARERCLRAIRDLLDVLPSTTETPPLALFNELERTGDFDATLGALARNQRTHLQREWNRKNELATGAKRAEMEAMYQKNKVRRHLGIPPADSAADQPAEYDAIFVAFQQKLTELQQEMERQVKLLDDTENGAKQAWLAYREAA